MRPHARPRVVRGWRSGRAAGLSTLLLSTFSDVPWNAPLYARWGFVVVPQSEYDAALRERRESDGRSGLVLASRVAMARVRGAAAGVGSAIMPVVHMIHGYLGAGKTTFAKRLEAALPAVRFSPDEWMVTLYGHDPPAEHFEDYLNRVFVIAHDTWPKVTRVGCDVILDFGFWSRRLREQARSMAAQLGASTRMYALRCSEETARRRCLQRNLELGGSLFIAPETFDVLRSRFQPLSADEAHEVVVSD